MDTPTSPSDEVGTLTFEAGLSTLESLIERLEKGSVPLDEAIAFYEKGMELVSHCTALLDATEAKVNQLVTGAAGDVREVPLDGGSDHLDATPSPVGPLASARGGVTTSPMRAVGRASSSSPSLSSAPTNALPADPPTEEPASDEDDLIPF